MAVIYTIALVLSIAYGTNNIVQILPTLGYAPLALALVFFATWAANDKNLYAACLGISAFTKRLSRPQITALAGAIGITLAYIGIFNNLVTILTLLGVATAPIAPIYMSHYYTNRVQYQTKRPDYTSVKWSGIIAWTFGTAVGLATTPAASLGFELFTLTTAPAIDAFLASLIATLAIRKIAKDKI